MREVRSFHLEGTGVTSSGRFTFSTDLARDGKLHYAVRLKDERMEMVQASDSVYMRANSAFWRANGVRGPSIRLDGRWVEAPAAVVRSLTATVSGRRALVIVDRGNQPGGAPGLLYVQADGPARLLRAAQTGPITPGPGTDPQCSDGEASTVRGD